MSGDKIVYGNFFTDNLFFYMFLSYCDTINYYKKGEKIMRINSVQAQNQNLQTNRKSQPKFEARLDRGGESLVYLAKALSTKYDKKFLSELIGLLSKNQELKNIKLFAKEQGGLEPRFSFAKTYARYLDGFYVQYIDPFTKHASGLNLVDLEEPIIPAALAKKIVVTLQMLNSEREQDLAKKFPQNPALKIKQMYLEELKASVDDSTISGKGIEKIQNFLGLKTPQAILDVKWHAIQLWDAQQSYLKELVPTLINSVQQMTTDDIPKLEKFIGRELSPDRQTGKIMETARSIGQKFGATGNETDDLALKIIDFDPSFWLGKYDRM